MARKLMLVLAKSLVFRQGILHMDHQHLSTGYLDFLIVDGEAELLKMSILSAESLKTPFDLASEVPPKSLSLYPLVR